MYRTILAAALLTAATGAAPGNAANVCLENNQLTFNPPLTAAMQAGTVTIAYQGTCADLPGLTPGHYSGVQTVGYFGSCALAFTAEGGTSVIVGGTLYAFVRGTVQVKAEVLQPNFPCPISSAHGTGIITSVP
jgi:hypothetical protein